MEYSDETLGVKLALPDELTVREQLQVDERVFLAAADGVDIYSRYWLGILPLIEDWECERIADPEVVDMDTETDPKVARIVRWVANTAAGHMAGLDDVPKNS
jgi:hypothetical protein